MIISTPIFEHSRMIRTFKEAYSEQKALLPKQGEVGGIEKGKTAAKAAAVTIATEIGLISMI